MVGQDEWKLPEAGPRCGWSAEHGGPSTRKTPLNLLFSADYLVLNKEILTLTFLILAHGLIFPKSLMMSSSLPKAFIEASKTRVKVPLCPMSGCVHCGSQEWHTCVPAVGVTLSLQRGKWNQCMFYNLSLSHFLNFLRYVTTHYTLSSKQALRRSQAP